MKILYCITREDIIPILMRPRETIFVMLVSGPWVNRVTLLNYTLIRSSKINFLIYMTSFWRFEKREKRQQSASVNFFLVKIEKKLQNLSIITVDYRNFYSNEVGRWSLYINFYRNLVM